MKRVTGLFASVLLFVLLLAGCWVQGGLLTESSEADVLLIWEREGGIVGFCDVVTVYDDGSGLVSTCSLTGVAVTLTADERATVVAWERAYRTFETSVGETDIPDGMRETVEFYGAGDALPNEAQLLEIEQFALVLLLRATSTN